MKETGHLSSTSDFYNYAQECIRLAQQASDAGTKARLLQMAQAWRDLAEKSKNDEQPSE